MNQNPEITQPSESINPEEKAKNMVLAFINSKASSWMPPRFGNKAENIVNNQKKESIEKQLNEIVLLIEKYQMHQWVIKQIHSRPPLQPNTALAILLMYLENTDTQTSSLSPEAKEFFKNLYTILTTPNSGGHQTPRVPSGSEVDFFGAHNEQADKE